MGKEEFFSKLNIKDYNNMLENILEKKDFSEDTKNILLNILYKMENSYEDYNKVKVETNSKKELLEEILNIIENDCDEIEIVRPKLNEKTKLENEKFIIDKENKKAISYPNEKNVFYALYSLQENKFLVDKKYDVLKEPVETLFNKAYKMDKTEIIRDFDGWSWNIVTDEIESYLYNLIYQNIKMVVGNNFLKTCIYQNNFIEKLENKLNEISDFQIAEKIYKISILEYIKSNEQKQEEMQITKQKLSKQLEKLENKKVYLQELANSKKEIGKEIKKIDELLNDNKLLRQKFINRNRELEESERVFSLSEYTEILQERRENYLKKLEYYSSLMKPMNYVKNKADLKKNVDILEQIDLEDNYEEQITKILNDLQLDFLSIYKEKIKKAQSKKELMEHIFLFRYYKLIRTTKTEQIKDNKQINEQLNKVEKQLITKACKSKLISILCQDINKNYEIISEIFNSKIIDLEDIILEFKQKENKILINVYDDNMIEKTLEYENLEDLNVKLNKKTKLFI